MKKIIQYILIVFILNFIGNIFSQEKNLTIYPYGGIPDSSRYDVWMNKIPLNFKRANFDSIQFNNLADFNEAKFRGSTYFVSTVFKRDVYFLGTFFDKFTYFNYTEFYGKVHFSLSHFAGVLFYRAKFHDFANFGEYECEPLHI